MPSLSCHPLRATPRPLTPVRRERTRGSSRAGFAPPRGRADGSIVSVKICCLKGGPMSALGQKRTPILMRRRENEHYCVALLRVVASTTIERTMWGSRDHHRCRRGYSRLTIRRGQPSRHAQRLATSPTGSPGNRGNHAPCGRSEGGCVDCRRR